MRGIQIKQPFRSGTQENIMEFIIPTTNLTQIKFSLAAKSDGSAETLLAEYWNGSQWTNAGLPISQTPIGANFTVILFDFSSVAVANNNPAFKIRLRFDGADMTSDTGKAVHINNIALEGQTSSLATNEQSIGKNNVKIFPNPAGQHAQIVSNEIIEHLSVYSVSGKIVHQSKPQKLETSINLEKLETGIYFVKIKSKSGETTLKLIKK